MSPLAGVWNGLPRWVFGAVMAVGGAGVAMRIAGVHSTFSSATVLLFLAVVPTLAIYGLLHSFDPFARIVLACTANVVFLALAATLMLTEGVWSPVGGLLAVVALTLVCLLAQWPPVRRHVATTARSWRTVERSGMARAGATDRELNGKG